MAFDGSYPAPPGNKNESVIDVAGPTSYATAVVGTPPTGGQLVTASQFGLQSIELCSVHMLDSTGAYEVIPALTPYEPNNCSPSVRLTWISLATGAQPANTTNLSASKIRIFARGQ